MATAKPTIFKTIPAAFDGGLEHSVRVGKQTGRIWQSDRYEWRYTLDHDENTHRPCFDAEDAFEGFTIAALTAAGIDLVPSLGMTADEAKELERGDRNAYTKALRRVLQKRTGRLWSVKGGTGTAWDWIRVTAPPARCGRFRYMGAEDQAILSAVTGENPHSRGFNIPPTRGYRAAIIMHSANGSADGIECSEHAWD